MVMKTVKILGREVQVNLRTDADKSVFEEILVDRDYKILDEIIGNAKHAILDLGAHIGLFSIYVDLLNTTVPLFAFEPEQENYALMKENLKLNHVKNVTTKNVAVVGDGSKPTRDLHISYDSHNHSLFNLENSTVVQRVSAISVKEIFDRILGRAKIEFCDLVKMDLEGGEFEIIKSMPREVFKKIGAFYMEYHEYFPEFKADHLKRIFEENGFKVVKKPSHYDFRMGFIFASR